MLSASALPQRYSIGKTYFYQRRDYLIKLGYDMEAVKDGRKKIYTDEQIQILDELDAHIKDTGSMEAFPEASAAPLNTPTQSVSNDPAINDNSGLVHADKEPSEINETAAEEIYVDTNPLADIQEQQLASVEVAAQYSAAQNLTAFNYLTVDYMKHRDFSVQELAEEVHKSEQAVRKTFDSMMQNPTSATKKIMAKLQSRRSSQRVRA